MNGIKISKESILNKEQGNVMHPCGLNPRLDLANYVAGAFRLHCAGTSWESIKKEFGDHIIWNEDDFHPAPFVTEDEPYSAAFETIIFVLVAVTCQQLIDIFLDQASSTRAASVSEIMLRLVAEDVPWAKDHIQERLKAREKVGVD